MIIKKKILLSLVYNYYNFIILYFIEEYYNNPLLPDTAEDVDLNNMALVQDNMRYPIHPWRAERAYFYPKHEKKRGNQEL